MEQRQSFVKEGKFDISKRLRSVPQRGQKQLAKLWAALSNICSKVGDDRFPAPAKIQLLEIGGCRRQLHYTSAG